jgi:hypothetical protein
MYGKLMFGAGLGLGYVLGTRAGRESFDKISGKAKQIQESKTVHDATDRFKEQAGRLYEGGKQMMSDQTQKMQQSHPSGPQQESPQRQEPHVGPVLR